MTVCEKRIFVSSIETAIELFEMSDEMANERFKLLHRIIGDGDYDYESLFLNRGVMMKYNDKLDHVSRVS
jgi:hypothetical protein